MSTSKAIKPKRDDAPLGNWDPIPERAPSLEQEDQPIVARVLAMIGLFLLVLGGLAMLATLWQRAAALSPDWGYRIATVGLVLIFYHAFVERDFQFRRIYAFSGVVLALGAVIIRLLAFRPDNASWFLLLGVPALFLGLVLLIAVIRQESDVQFKNVLQMLVGILGAVLIGWGILGTLGLTSRFYNARALDFIGAECALVMLLGLLYVSSFIALESPTSERSYKAGLALGAAGILGIVVGVIFAILPADAIATRIPANNFLVPSGLILIGMSIVNLVFALGVCVDLPIIVLARRELAAYFFSPVAYLVLIGQVLFAWIMFGFFVSDLRDPRRGGSGLLEPIIMHYVINIIPVFVMMFFVPAITMRLVSEEKRSGTLEVLLTAPVNELSIVTGKFIASWMFYLLLWLPWWIFLVSLRYFGNEEFDYRPVLSFMVAQVFLSAGFISMGVFFSSLTSNQIIAAVFTFVGMMAHLILYFAQGMAWFSGNALGEVFAYVNFVELWIESLRGTIAPRYLVFQASLTFFFLFATVKVLESRKWK